MGKPEISTYHCHRTLPSPDIARNLQQSKYGRSKENALNIFFYIIWRIFLLFSPIAPFLSILFGTVHRRSTASWFRTLHMSEPVRAHAKNGAHARKETVLTSFGNEISSFIPTLTYMRFAISDVSLISSHERS